MHDGSGYSVTLEGDGLEEYLLSRELTIHPSVGLLQKDAFERINQANALVRDMLRGYTDEPSHSLDSIRLWRFRLVVPAECGQKPASFEIIDCPGGGEAGLVGAAVKRILQHCMSIAGMVLLNVKVDNIVCLDDEQRLLPFFGGTRPDAKLALTINAVEDAPTRRGANERSQEDIVRTTLQRLGVTSDAIFYVSGRTILECGVAQSLMRVTSFEELRTIASLGSSANNALSLLDLCAVIQSDLGISGPPTEVVEQGARRMQLSGSGSLIERARLVVSSLGHETGEGASQSHLLPALESMHGGSREVLVGLYKSGLFGGAGLAVEEIESRHRQHALGDICLAYAADCSDNVKFVDLFDNFLRETWPRMQIEALLRGAINAVERRLEERKRAVTAAQQSSNECRAKLERMQRAMSELDRGLRTIKAPPLDGDGSELFGIVLSCLIDAVDASRFATSTAPEAASLFGHPSNPAAGLHSAEHATGTDPVTGLGDMEEEEVPPSAEAFELFQINTLTSAAAAAVAGPQRLPEP